MAIDDYFLFKANEFFEKAKSEANREKRIAFENVAQGYLRMAEQAMRKKESAADSELRLRHNVPKKRRQSMMGS